MKKIKEFHNLHILYFNCYLTKLNLIIMLLGLVLLTAIYYISLDLDFNLSYYYIYSDNYHLSYFNQTFLPTRIFLSLFIFILEGCEAKEDSNKLNQMLSPSFKRGMIYFSKLISLFEIYFIYLIIVLSIYIALPEICYNKFTIGSNLYKFIIYLIVEGLISVTFGYIIINLLPSYFTSFLVLIIYVALVVITGENIGNISYFFPLLISNNLFDVSFRVPLYYASLYLIILILLGYLMYQRKEYR